MPNGECPVGSKVLAMVNAQGREIGEIKDHQAAHDVILDKIVVASAVREWKMGVIIACGTGVIVVGLNFLLDWVMAHGGG